MHTHAGTSVTATAAADRPPNTSKLKALPPPIPVVPHPYPDFTDMPVLQVCHRHSPVFALMVERSTLGYEGFALNHSSVGCRMGRACEWAQLSGSLSGVYPTCPQTVFTARLTHQAVQHHFDLKSGVWSEHPVEVRCRLCQDWFAAAMQPPTGRCPARLLFLCTCARGPSWRLTHTTRLARCGTGQSGPTAFC